MLYLKEINLTDIDEEYRAITSIPANENGLENKYHDVTKEEFRDVVIPTLNRNSKGLDLPKGYVPDTYYFLWDDDKIVGLFKIRHYLNDFLRKNAGHMGAAILPGDRGKGYGVNGLKLAIEKCFEIIPEDEIYTAVHKDNAASLKMQLDNHAYIAEENDEEYLLRIKRNTHDITFGFRDLERNDWKRVIDKEVVIDDISTDIFEGKICLLHMKQVSGPLSVDSPIGKIKIADNGYKHLMIAPKNKNWWLTIMYDENDNLIESYFDITKTNCFDASTPYFVDMKLDVCIPNNANPSIMDDSELKEALDAGMITQIDYDNAYKTANQIINFYNNNKELYYSFINEIYEKMKTKLKDDGVKHI